MPEIGTIFAKLGLDFSPFQKGIGEAKVSMSGLSETLNNGFSTTGIKDYSNTLSGLRLQLRTLRNEYSVLSSSEADVEEKIASLNQQIRIQQSVVDMANERWQKSVDEQGAMTKASMQLESRLSSERRTLADLESQLRGIASSEIKAEEEMLGFGQSAGETKEKLEGVHASMMAFMGIMAGGVIAEWSEGAEQMAINLQKLHQETGDSGPSLERLSIVASGAGVSMDQLSQMVGRLDMRIGQAATPSKQFLDSLNALHISAEEFTSANTPEQAQMIAEAMDKAHMPTKQLDTVLKGLGITARDLGHNTAQNLSIIQESLTRTAETSSALGRALTTAGINMSTFVSASTEDKIRMLGKYMEETNDKAKATSLVMQVFGRSGAQMLPLIENFAELDEYAKELKMPVMDTNEIQIAAEKTKMLQTAMQMLMDSAMAKLLPFVDRLGKGFYDLMTNIQHPIDAIREFVKDMGPVQAAVVGVVMAFTAMKIVNSITSTIQAFVETTKAATIAIGLMKNAEGEATGVMAAFNAVMDGNIIGIVALAVAGLALAGIELVTHWRQVTNFLSGIWHDIENFAVNIFNGIKNFFAKWGIDILAVLAPAIGMPILIAQHWQQIVSFAQQIWSAVVNFIKGIWTSFTNWISNAAQAVALAVINGFKWMYDHNYYVKNLVDFIIAIWTQFSQWITQAWTNIVKVAETIWTILKTWYTAYWNAIMKFFVSIWTSIQRTLTTIWNDIINLAKTLFTPISLFFNDLWQGISNVTNSIWSSIRNSLSNLWNSAVNDAKNIWNGLRTFFTGLWNEAEQWGANLIRMFAQGIKNAAGEVMSAVRSVANGISSFLGFHSPAEQGPGADADRWMGNLMNMLAEDVESNTGRLHTALGKAIPGFGSNFNTNIPASLSSLSQSTSTRPIIVYLDGREIARETAPHLVNEIRLQTGLTL